MRIVEKIADLKTIIKAQKREEKTIGFVPTMDIFMMDIYPW